MGNFFANFRWGVSMSNSEVWNLSTIDYINRSTQSPNVTWKFDAVTSFLFINTSKICFRENVISFFESIKSSKVKKNWHTYLAWTQIKLSHVNFHLKNTTMIFRRKVKRKLVLTFLVPIPDPISQFFAVPQKVL